MMGKRMINNRRRRRRRTKSNNNTLQVFSFPFDQPHLSFFLFFFRTVIDRSSSSSSLLLSSDRNFFANEETWPLIIFGRKYTIRAARLFLFSKKKKKRKRKEIQCGYNANALIITLKNSRMINKFAPLFSPPPLPSPSKFYRSVAFFFPPL